MLRRAYPYALASGLGIAIGYYVFNEPLKEAAELARSRADDERQRRRAEQSADGAGEPEWRRARRERQRHEEEEEKEEEAAMAAAAPARGTEAGDRARRR
jgi:hypothetical protein